MAMRRRNSTKYFLLLTRSNERLLYPDSTLCEFPACTTVTSLDGTVVNSAALMQLMQMEFQDCWLGEAGHEL